MPYTRKTSDIFVSRELQDILRQFESSSEVARLLLKQRHSLDILVPDHVNYISICKKDPTKLSYLTPDRFDKTDDVWSSSKRFVIKPGGFVKKIFVGISEKEVEKFTTLYRSVISAPKFQFKVVEGSEILKWYSYENYACQSDSLGASCMKHNSCQKFLNLYQDNTDKVKMLIMLDRENRLLSRSILWTLAEDLKVMDRIYTVNDNDYAYHFKRWADDNSFIYKREQKWNNTLFFESKGQSFYKEISFQLTNFNYRWYPYLDTFKFFDQKTGTFYNYIPESVDVITLSTPDGSRQPQDFLALDGRSKLFYHYHDTVELSYLGYRVHASQICYSELYNTHLHKDDAKYDESLNDWIYSDDSRNNQELIEKRKEEIRIRQEQYKKAREEASRQHLGCRVTARHISDLSRELTNNTDFIFDYSTYFDTSSQA